MWSPVQEQGWKATAALAPHPQSSYLPMCERGSAEEPTAH